MSSVSINELPTEILQKTLRYLPPLDLIRGRRVCSRWRDVVDSVNEQYWHQACRQEFPSIYKDARRKSHPSLSWHELYKSLRLWGKLDLAEENWIQICNYSDVEDRVSKVSAIGGKLCVHEKCKIVYYDLKGEKIKEFNTEQEYKSFRETESVIAYDIQLVPRRPPYRYECSWPIRGVVVVKKSNGEPDLSRKVVIRDVQEFGIVGEDVYYKKYIFYDGLGNYKIHCQLLVAKAKDNYESTIVSYFETVFFSFGCKNDALNVLKYPGDVFALEKDKLVIKERDNLSEPKIYRHIVNTYFPYSGYAEPLITAMMDNEVGFWVREHYFYGDTTFLGCEDGILRVYNTKQFLDNPQIEPICQFDIESQLKPKPQYSYGIKGIDIVEKENGHIILVAIAKGVFAIELTHSSNRSRRSARIKKQNLITTTEPKNCKKIKLGR